MDQRAIFSKEMFNVATDVPPDNFDLVIIGKITKRNTNATQNSLYTNKKIYNVIQVKKVTIVKLINFRIHIEQDRKSIILSTSIPTYRIGTS